MRIPPTIAASLAVIAMLAGVSDAAPPAASLDESFFSLDLTSVDGSTYHLMCQHKSKEAVGCGIPSLWEETNTLRGLQSIKYSASGRLFEPDTPLLA